MTPAELEHEALAANAEFYRVFNAGDFAAMQALWAAQHPVACLHPGQPLLFGRAAVLQAWRQILAQQPGFQLRGDEPRVQLLGETAIVYCYEAGEDAPAHLAATNVFVREGAAWRMVHHHAGPLATPRPAPRASDLN
jgi:ketosteroid isomerase-like protein